MVLELPSSSNILGHHGTLSISGLEPPLRPVSLIYELFSSEGSNFFCKTRDSILSFVATVRCILFFVFFTTFLKRKKCSQLKGQTKTGMGWIWPPRCPLTLDLVDGAPYSLRFLEFRNQDQLGDRVFHQFLLTTYRLYFLRVRKLICVKNSPFREPE